MGMLCFQFVRNGWCTRTAALQRDCRVMSVSRRQPKRVMTDELQDIIKYLYLIIFMSRRVMTDELQDIIKYLYLCTFSMINVSIKQLSDMSVRLKQLISGEYNLRVNEKDQTRSSCMFIYIYLYIYNVILIYIYIYGVYINMYIYILIYIYTFICIYMYTMYKFI